MDDITEMAEALGKAIYVSPEATKLREARKAMATEPEALQLLKDYNAQVQKIEQVEQEKKPVDPEDKRTLEELHGRLVSLESFKKFTAAQVDYVDLMRKVNEVIRKQIAETELA